MKTITEELDLALGSRGDLSEDEVLELTAEGRIEIYWDKWSVERGKRLSRREQHLRRLCAGKEQGNQTNRTNYLAA